MKRWSKRLLWSAVGTIVALCLLITLGLVVVTMPRVTNGLLASYVPQFVRAEVSVERLRLRTFSVFPNLEVELVQPVVVSTAGTHSSSGAMSDTLLTADTLRVRLSPCALALRRVHLREVLMSRPRLFIAERDGRYNFDILLPDTIDNDTIPSTPFRFEWDTLRLTDGVITLHSDLLRVERLTIDSLQIASSGQYHDTTLSALLDMGLRVGDAQFRVNEVTAQCSGSRMDTLAARVWLSVPHVENLLAMLPDTLRRQTIRDNTLSGGICLAASLGVRSSGLQCADVDLRIDSLNGGHPHRTVHLDNLTVRACSHYDADKVDSAFIRLDTLQFAAGRSTIHARANALYKNRREHVSTDLQARLYLKELAHLFALDQKCRVRGVLRADIYADGYPDELMQGKIYNVRSASTLQGDDLFLAIPELRTRVVIDSLRAEAKTNMRHVSRRTGKANNALFNMQLAFRRMQVKHRRQTDATVDRTMIRLYADQLNDHTPPTLHASVTLQGLQGQHNDTLRVRAKRLRVSAGMRPDSERGLVPTTSARVSMDSVLLANPRNGAVLDSLRVSLSTTPRYRRFRMDTVTRKPVPIPESEWRVMNLDSLIRYTHAVLQDSLPMETYVKRFRTTGDVYVRRFGIRHRGDDLRPTVSRMELTLNDDSVRLNRFRLRIGRSAVSLTGDVQHLRRYLLRGKTLDANLTLRSRRLDLNQLANAFARQQRKLEVLDSISAQQNMQLLTDTVPMDELAADTLMTDSLLSSLIVLPSNLNVTFNAKVDTVIFSQMRLHNFHGKVRLHDQTLAATNVSTSTKVGRMEVNVRYTCRDTAEAAAAAALSMDSVQVGELMEALPELDSVMPMLRSFDGSMACDAAAQLRLRSDLSIDLPSVNAGVWLRGQNMVLMDGETFSEIAKKLMFSKKTRNMIDSLSVELLVRNNQVEIFPFMLSMDKYQVGVGGNQMLDGSFNYHISVFKPLNLGLDVYGDDFDHVRFKMVKPKYKSATSKIGKGGTLLRQQDANVIPNIQKSIRSYILEMNR